MKKAYLLESIFLISCLHDKAKESSPYVKIKKAEHKITSLKRLKRCDSSRQHNSELGLWTRCLHVSVLTSSLGWLHWGNVGERPSL